MKKRTSSAVLAGLAAGIAALFMTTMVIGPQPGRSGPTVPPGRDSATKRALARKYDVVVVKGEFLRNFNGVSIEKLALMAFRDNKLSPVPFQIDERDRKGRFIMSRGKTAGSDNDGGKLDANDELLFFVADAGDRLPLAERADKIEIEVTDPRYTDLHAWTYLAHFKTGEPPRSNVDYVNYDPSTERIISKNYILGYRKGHMFYNDVIYPISVGGDGKDFFDRVKLRFRIELLGGRMTFVRNEDAMKAEVRGWIDGPVRVLQSTINRVKLLDMFPPVTFNGISEYYPCIHASPMIIKFPVDFNSFMNVGGVQHLVADIVADMPGLVGGNAYTNLAPNGFVYTGHSPLEVLNRIPRIGLVWGFATKKGVGTFFPRLVFPDVMYQFNAFYITDDESYDNPPDDVPGEIGAGVRFDFQNYPAGVFNMYDKKSFMLKFETYFAKPGLTPDGAREWLDIQDYPLLADVRVGSEVESPPSRVKVRANPPWKGGRDGTITDVRDRKIHLNKIAFFIGSIEVDARFRFGGERVADASPHIFPLSQIKSITNYCVEFDPHTKTKMAMFHKVTLTDGSSFDLMGCRACGWGGMDEEGRIVYYSNVQIKRIDFSHES